MTAERGRAVRASTAAAVRSRGRREAEALAAARRAVGVRRLDGVEAHERAIEIDRAEAVLDKVLDCAESLRLPAIGTHAYGRGPERAGVVEPVQQPLAAAGLASAGCAPETTRPSAAAPARTAASP